MDNYGHSFFVLGMFYGGNTENVSEIAELQAKMDEAFLITPWLLAVPVIVLGLITLRAPAIPGLIVGVLLGAIIAYFIQGETLKSVSDMMIGGFEKQTGHVVIDELLSNGGIRVNDAYSCLSYVSNESWRYFGAERNSNSDCK